MANSAALRTHERVKWVGLRLGVLTTIFFFNMPRLCEAGQMGLQPVFGSRTVYGFPKDETQGNCNEITRGGRRRHGVEDAMTWYERSHFQMEPDQSFQRNCPDTSYSLNLWNV